MLQERIEKRLQEQFNPEHLQVINESSMHRVPPGAETHFKVVVATTRFQGQSIVERHQSVYSALAEEMKAGIHALSIQAHTPEEWQKKGGKIPASPKCSKSQH